MLRKKIVDIVVHCLRTLKLGLTWFLWLYFSLKKMYFHLKINEAERGKKYYVIIVAQEKFRNILKILL